MKLYFQTPAKFMKQPENVYINRDQFKPKTNYGEQKKKVDQFLRLTDPGKQNQDSVPFS